MNKFNTKPIISILVASVLATAHVVIAIAFVKVFKYYSIYPEIFNLLTIMIICLLIIVDIIFFICIRYNNIIQKIIVLVIAICISIGGIFGTTLLSKTATIVDNVITIDSSSTKTEMISGVFVTYNTQYSEIDSLDKLKTIEDLKVGTLLETSQNSLSTIGIQELENAGVKVYTDIGYTNNTDLLFALISGQIDVAIFSNMYKAIFRADDNVDYSQYLNQMNEFAEFEKEIEITSNASKKDLSKDPFNVLLIGWSPIIGSTTIGLADAIIVATVNPQTYTVSMMSIARDSYVPITCYGGECDKINSGRGTSMDCFVSTVENLIGEEIDFYMEINFAGFAILVDCLGGAEINNPVSFELDGVYVPAGNYVASGWQALQFARERHHMPNGDFDRQQHQKEVIMQVAKRFLKHDLTFALDVFNEISPFLNTNMTFTQLSGIFNMLKATKNYTGLSLFKMLDMHALRITGYADWHYSDEYELPLWIYRLYQGSISESLQHIREVMGEETTIEQYDGFQFNTDYPYVREAFYSTEYNEVETHEKLPPYYKNLTSMTYKEAVEWAKENGATLDPTFIYSDEEEYDETLDGMVISQSVAYGKKVANYPICRITVMGSGKDNPDFPDYEEWESDWLSLAKEWCKENGYTYETEANYISKEEASGYSDGQVYKMKYYEREDFVKIKYYKICGDNAVPNEDGSGCQCKEGYKTNSLGVCQLQATYTYIKDGVATKVETRAAGDKPNWSAPSDEYVCSWSSDGLTYTCNKHTHIWAEESKTAATCEKDGKIVYKCSSCGKTKEETIKATNHNMVKDESTAVVTSPTCGTDGYTTYTWKCANEGCTHTESIKDENSIVSATGEHTYDESEWIIIQDPTCTEAGLKYRKCSVCGHEESPTSIDPTGHTPEEVAEVAATTESAGSTAGHKCSKCGEVLDGCEEIPQLT